MKKIIKYLIAFWVFFLLLICIMGATRHVLTGGKKINGTPKDIILFLSSFLSNVENIGNKSKPQTIRSASKLKNGFNRTKNYTKSKDYILVSFWDDKLGQSAVKLIRIEDGKMMHKWVIDIPSVIRDFNTKKMYKKLSDPEFTIETTNLKHPYLMNDGSLIFGAGGLFRVNKNSKITWSHLMHFHHSIEPDADGNLWVCDVKSVSKNAQKHYFRDDIIQKISPETGKVMYEKSVIDILMENDYNRGHFFANYAMPSESTYLDYVHLNDIQPVFSDSKYWKKGDLFLSLRQQNMVLLYRPSTNKIIWSQNGPWLKQHDVYIIDSARIGIFGNNVIDSKLPDPNTAFIDGHNVEYIYNFSTKKCSTPYTAFFKSSGIRTHTQGRARILKNGDIFVEETIGGRILFGSKDKEKWTYIDRIDENHLSLFSWSRYITEEEFKKLTFIKKNKK